MWDLVTLKWLNEQWENRLRERRQEKRERRQEKPDQEPEEEKDEEPAEDSTVVPLTPSEQLIYPPNTGGNDESSRQFDLSI